MASTPETTSADVGNTIRVLEHHNYHSWIDMTQLYFLVHNLDGIVDGSEAPPTAPSPENSNWLLRQKKAAGFIALKLDALNRDLFLTPDNR